MVVLTVFENPSVILDAIAAGANGYVLKKTGARELVAQLRSVLDGGASTSTVRTHVRAIYRKLRVHSVAEAVRKAVQAGLW